MDTTLKHLSHNRNNMDTTLKHLSHNRNNMDTTLKHLSHNRNNMDTTLKHLSHNRNNMVTYCCCCVQAHLEDLDMCCTLLHVNFHFQALDDAEDYILKANATLNTAVNKTRHFNVSQYVSVHDISQGVKGKQSKRVLFAIE